ncbi:hypothetical protein [Tropicibacter alexandrii]|uniref:hypothetical protein n=1 Tax=Tropicibacter alexandrii TaxID=2267683 RepID=UPI000EF45D3A|nr:hypothetical protein [Tropicibacter alexandrii]
MRDDLEQFLARVPSDGEAVEIPASLLGPPPAIIGPDGPEDHETDAAAGVELVELVSLPTFQDQWGMLHDMLGGMVQMRTGAPCPLGDQARGEGGRVACEAAYNLIAASPTLSRMILSPESSFFGQLAAVGVHGFACVQIVKASATGQTLPEPQEEFAA